MARVYHRLNGRGRKVYYIDYSVLGVRKRERVGYDEGQAKEALQSRLTDIRRQKFDGILPEPTCTLDEIWPRYLLEAEARKTKKQVEREIGIYEKHLKPKFGKLALNEITPNEVEEHQAKRKAARKAASTINKEVQLLKYVTKKAVQWGKIRTNRIAGVKPFKEPPGRVRYLEWNAFDRLVEAAPKWLRAIILICAHTGMRRGEICRLTRESIDRNNGLIYLPKTKNGEARIIPMNKTVIDVVSSLPPRLDTPYLFAEKDGKPISKNKVSMAFKRATRKAGIKNFRLHDLRHQFASYLTMGGQNQRTLMELLGHKDPKMTTRYQHLSNEHLRAAVECLDTREKAGARS